MRAVVIGATGATGSELVRQLLADNEVTEVTALVRRPGLRPHQKLTEVIVDFDHLQRSADAIRGDIAFSCLGTTLKIAGSRQAQWKVDFDYQYDFARLARQNGMDRFVLLSSMGANPKSRIFYSRMKGELESGMEQLGFEYLMIFQPGILIRPGSDRSGEKMSVSVLKFFNRLGMFNAYQPVSVGDLAAAMISMSKTPSVPVERVSLRSILNRQKT